MMVKIITMLRFFFNIKKKLLYEEQWVVVIFLIYFERTQSLLSILYIVYTLQYSRIADQRLQIYSPPTENMTNKRIIN